MLAGNESIPKKIIKGIKEVSDITGLSVYAIRTGIREGVFPAFQINGCGGKYFINIDDFQNAMHNLGSINMNHQNESGNIVNINGIRKITE
jgi:hypothetical protein